VSSPPLRDRLSLSPQIDCSFYFSPPSLRPFEIVYVDHFSFCFFVPTAPPSRISTPSSIRVVVFDTACLYVSKGDFRYLASLSPNAFLVVRKRSMHLFSARIFSLSLVLPSSFHPSRVFRPLFPAVKNTRLPFVCPPGVLLLVSVPVRLPAFCAQTWDRVLLFNFPFFVSFLFIRCKILLSSRLVPLSSADSLPEPSIVLYTPSMSSSRTSS